MRKLAIAAALLMFGMFTTPASARDGAWYVGGEFGAMIVEDTDIDNATTDNIITLNHEYGYDGGLFVGYDLGGFRLEAEVAYKKADLSGFTNLVVLPGEGPATFPGGRDFAGGSTSALSFMLNGMLDFGDDDGVQGFVGGGIGMARVKFNNQRVFANTAPFLDDSDSRLAWQLFAGVRQSINDNIDITVKYRFFNVPDIKLVAVTGGAGTVSQDVETRFRSHSLLGGITFNFGKKPPVELCPDGVTPVRLGPCPKQCDGVGPWVPHDYECPVTCPPPAVWNPQTKRCETPIVCEAPTVWNPTTQRCECPDGRLPDANGRCLIIPPGPAIVFFDWDKWNFVSRTVDQPTSPTSNRTQEEILQDVVDIYNSGRRVQLRLSGHADTSGPPSYNYPLSERRAQTIREELVKRGIPNEAISTSSFGEDQPRKPTGDGVREVDNRRVEILWDVQPD